MQEPIPEILKFQFDIDGDFLFGGCFPLSVCELDSTPGNSSSDTHTTGEAREHCTGQCEITAGTAGS